MNSRKNKKTSEKTVVLVGAAMILLVFLITFFRWGNQNKNSEPIISPEENYQYNKISFQEIQKKISPLASENEKILIIDIRENEHYQTEHIIGSKNIPLKDLAGAELNAENHDLIIIAGYGREEENIEAAKILNRRNISNVVVFPGGFFAWKRKGGQTISRGDPKSFADQSKISPISPEDLKVLLDENYNAYILDVRSRQSFSQGHIPKAVNIPLNELENRRNEIPLTKEIIAYGSNDSQGFRAGVMLYDMNFFSAWVLEGGFTKWKEKGFEITQ